MLTKDQKFHRNLRRWDLRLLRLALDRNDLTERQRHLFGKWRRLLRQELRVARHEVRAEIVYEKAYLEVEEREEVTRVANKGLTIPFPLVKTPTDLAEEKLDAAFNQWCKTLDAALNAIEHGTH